MGQAVEVTQSDLKTPFVGNTLTCSKPERLSIPKPLAERAKLKARLLTILRESLYDDAKGIVNVEREREIKNLANKLKDERAHEMPSY